ncbi:MAG: 4Fe-4S binding protein [Caldilineaceae bacterium]|nr:4Fe-4S binding protein [Caldilineaceae bacterium]
MRHDDNAAGQHFGGAAIEVRSNGCLNRRHKDAGCTLCAAACPTGAIALTSAYPQLDDSLCVRCGACLHTCPTDVYTQHKPVEITLKQTIEQTPAQAQAIVCPLHPSPQSTALPVERVVRHARCLAALSPVQLLELSRNGQSALWLDDAPCGDCPISAAQRVLASSVSAANQWLSALGQAASIGLYSTAFDNLLSEAVTRPLVDGMAPQFSRRGFFGAIRRNVENRLHESMLESPAVAAVRSTRMADRLPQRVPESRIRLLHQLRSADAGHRSLEEDIALSDDLPLAVVEVDAEECSACGLCAQFCPTGALSLIQEEEAFHLNFQPSICLDCGICAVVCPEDAIAFGEYLPIASLLRDEVYALASGKLVSCAQCHTPTADAGADIARCFACRQGVGSVKPLVDQAGLMADLLSRIPDRE